MLDRFILKVGGIIAIASFSLISAPTQARDASQCLAYAQQAAKDAATVSICEFTGPRFSFDVEQHRLWCLNARDQDIALEENARLGAVDTCYRCGTYASDAIVQNAENVKRNCGGTGYQWHSDSRVHRLWCVNQHPGVVQAEKTERARLLVACGKK